MPLCKTFAARLYLKSIALKMQTVRFFERYIVRDISLSEIYRWLIEILSAILKRTRHGGQSRERL